MHAHTKILLERAADDEATMRLEGLPEVPFGQHAQATVEKLLKALTNEHGVRYQRIHKLNDLKDDLAALGEVLPAVPINFGILTNFAMDLRYDDPGQMPPLDRQACRDAVTILRAYVLGRIQALNPPPPAL